MTVQELIDLLEKTQDKTKPVWIVFDGRYGFVPAGTIEENQHYVMIVEDVS
jgi:hypothetical protein